MRYHFPSDLADIVTKRWNTAVVGDRYTPPTLPPYEHLKLLLETAYLSSMEKDESRQLRFALCYTPNTNVVTRSLVEGEVEAWPFTSDRPLNVQEIRRLATVAGVDRAAIWIRPNPNPRQPLSIHGLLNLGSTWEDLRNGFTYDYGSQPQALLIRAEAPGQLKVYQGVFQIASLRSGTLEKVQLVTAMDLLGTSSLFQEGHAFLQRKITPPKHEDISDWYGFEYDAYVNAVLAIVNNVRLHEHGGAVIFARRKSRLIKDGFVKIKYSLKPLNKYLSDNFIDFMNLRHKLGDKLWLSERKKKDAPTKAEIRSVTYLMEGAQHTFIETCKFIGDLSGTDGAIVLRTDLTLEGFGAEIISGKASSAVVYKAEGPDLDQVTELDSRQFGMRHRSAMGLCSAVPDVSVFVVSQDGGVSLVWNDIGKTFFRQGIRTTNTLMPGG
jgi:hypothetical protein